MDSRARAYGYIWLLVVILGMLLYFQPYAHHPMPEPFQAGTLVLQP